MWLAPVLTPPPGASPVNLWKSWVTHRSSPPTQVLHEAAFRHLLATPATIRAQNRLRALSGMGGLWFAGGYLHPYDAQETALLSAIAVADGVGSQPSGVKSPSGLRQP
jgi:predicted NAD/FAD-binding protein